MRPTLPSRITIKPLKLASLPKNLRLPPALVRAAPRAGPSSSTRDEDATAPALKRPIPSSSLAAALPSRTQQGKRERLTLADELVRRQEAGMRVARTRTPTGTGTQGGEQQPEEQPEEQVQRRDGRGRAQAEEWPSNLHVVKFVHGKERFWNIPKEKREEHIKLFRES